MSRSCSLPQHANPCHCSMVDSKVLISQAEGDEQRMMMVFRMAGRPGKQRDSNACASSERELCELLEREVAHFRRTAAPKAQKLGSCPAQNHQDTEQHIEAGNRGMGGLGRQKTS